MNIKDLNINNINNSVESGMELETNNTGIYTIPDESSCSAEFSAGCIFLSQLL